MYRFDGKPILAESSYGVMESWPAFASVVVRPDTGNQCRKKDEIIDSAYMRTQLSFAFSLAMILEIAAMMQRRACFGALTRDSDGERTRMAINAVWWKEGRN